MVVFSCSIGQELVVLCLDLFMAGSKTTTDSLTAVLALALHHPEWIKALQKDLNDVVGPEAQPNAEHATQLPRIEAFLAEVMKLLKIHSLYVVIFSQETNQITT